MSPGDLIVQRLVKDFIAELTLALEELITARVRAYIPVIANGGSVERRPPKRILPPRKPPKHGGKVGPKRARPSVPPGPWKPKTPPPAPPPPKPAAVALATTGVLPEPEDAPALAPTAPYSEPKRAAGDEEAWKGVSLEEETEPPVPPPPPALQRLIDTAVAHQETAAEAPGPDASGPATEDGGDRLGRIAARAAERNAGRHQREAITVEGRVPVVGEVWFRPADGKKGEILRVRAEGAFEKAIQYRDPTTRRLASSSMPTFVKRWRPYQDGDGAGKTAPPAETDSDHAAWAAMAEAEDLAAAMLDEDLAQARESRGRVREVDVDEPAEFEPAIDEELPEKPEDSRAAASALSDEVHGLLDAGLADARAGRTSPVPYRVFDEDESFAEFDDGKAEASSPGPAVGQSLTTRRRDFVHPQYWTDEDREAGRIERETGVAQPDRPRALEDQAPPRVARVEAIDAGDDDGDEDEQIVSSVRKIRAKVRIGADGRTRAKTIAPTRLTREELSATDSYPTNTVRPVSREDCASMPRPCPFVSCAHHLYLDVNPDSGAIKLNFPHLEVWEMAETCSLDVADRGGITLEEVGTILNLTRERIRQVETRGLVNIRLVAGEALGLK